MNFDEAFERLIGHEGNYVNDPDDPGGETKFGISKRAYPGEDIANLTLERAKQIYLQDYWSISDSLPDSIKYDVFDVAVNSGRKQAIRLLQRAVGETQDGILGALTLQAVNSMNPFRLAARFNGYRLDFMNDLPTWSKFGKGWAQRVAEILEQV